MRKARIRKENKTFLRVSRTWNTLSEWYFLEKYTTGCSKDTRTKRKLFSNMTDQTKAWVMREQRMTARYTLTHKRLASAVFAADSRREQPRTVPGDPQATSGHCSDNQDKGGTLRSVTHQPPPRCCRQTPPACCPGAWWCRWCRWAAASPTRCQPRAASQSSAYHSAFGECFWRFFNSHLIVWRTRTH